MDQLVKFLLEKHLGRSNRVRRVRDDDIVGIGLVRQELEAIFDNNVDFGVLVADGEGREVFLGEPDDGLVDLAEGDRLDAVVLDDFTEHTAVTTANNQDLNRLSKKNHCQNHGTQVITLPFPNQSQTKDPLSPFRNMLASQQRGGVNPH